LAAPATTGRAPLEGVGLEQGRDLLRLALLKNEQDPVIVQVLGHLPAVTRDDTLSDRLGKLCQFGDSSPYPLDVRVVVAELVRGVPRPAVDGSEQGVNSFLGESEFGQLLAGGLGVTLADKRLMPGRCSVGMVIERRRRQHPDLRTLLPGQHDRG